MDNKENIFKRFFNFIKRLFGNEEPKQISEKAESIKEKEKKGSYFSDELKINKEEPELLKLQEQYENNELDLRTISGKQVHELNLLYKKQVEELCKELEEKKVELKIMQEKYSVNNA